MQPTRKHDVTVGRGAEDGRRPSNEMTDWKPQWLIDVDHDEIAGLTLDHGCFVVLERIRDGSWQPTTHIPRQAAERIAQLVPSVGMG
jgi:hypothetical protein